jgi:protein-tyrosine phosphatase
MLVPPSAIATFKILFVCLCNICRSPAAQGTMIKLLNEYNINNVEIDSAGTVGYLRNFLPDQRMRDAGSKRGIIIDHRARQIEQEDFDNFDLIIAMDNSNYDVLTMMGSVYDPYFNKDKIQKMINYVSDPKGFTEIPDPYFESEDDIKMVLDLIYDGCLGILKSLNLIK